MARREPRRRRVGGRGRRRPGMAGGGRRAMGEGPGDLGEYSEEYSFGSPWGGEDDRDDDEDEYFDEEDYSEDEYPGWEVIYEEEPEEEDEVAAGADGSETISSSFDGVAAERRRPPRRPPRPGRRPCPWCFACAASGPSPARAAFGTSRPWRTWFPSSPPSCVGGRRIRNFSPSTRPRACSTSARGARSWRRCARTCCRTAPRATAGRRSKSPPRPRAGPPPGPPPGTRRPGRLGSGCLGGGRWRGRAARIWWSA